MKTPSPAGSPVTEHCGTFEIVGIAGGGRATRGWPLQLTSTSGPRLSLYILVQMPIEELHPMMLPQWNQPILPHKDGLKYPETLSRNKSLLHSLASVRYLITEMGKIT